MVETVGLDRYFGYAAHRKLPYGNAENPYYIYLLACARYAAYGGYTVRVLNNGKHKKSAQSSAFFVVETVGLEPTTSRM